MEKTNKQTKKRLYKQVIHMSRCKLALGNTSSKATIPVVWVVPAQLYIGPAGSLLQPGLGHFQWALFVSQGLLQRFDQHLSLEDLLQSLGEETVWIQSKISEKQLICVRHS